MYIYIYIYIYKYIISWREQKVGELTLASTKIKKKKRLSFSKNICFTDFFRFMGRSLKNLVTFLPTGLFHIIDSPLKKNLQKNR